MILDGFAVTKHEGRQRRSVVARHELRLAFGCDPSAITSIAVACRGKLAKPVSVSFPQPNTDELKRNFTNPAVVVYEGMRALISEFFSPDDRRRIQVQPSTAQIFFE